MDAPETVTEAMALLEAEGYTSDFRVASTDDRSVHATGTLVVHRTFRFEGDSDPGDEAVVLGVECPSCGTKGIVVSAYGPDADPDLLALLDRLDR